MTVHPGPRSLSLAALFIILGCRAAPSEAPTSFEDHWSNRVPTRAEHAAWQELWRQRYARNTAAQLDFYRAGGLEMGTAGLHVTRPWVLDYQFAQALPRPLESCNGDWCFWDTKPRYDRKYWASGAPDRAPLHVIASYRRMPLGSVLATEVVPEPGTGTYSLIGHLGVRGLDRLRDLMTPISSEAGYLSRNSKYIDWLGVDRLGPYIPSEMRLLLVADDKAYCSFSVNDVLADVERNGATSASVLLADGLPEGEAIELAARLDWPR